MKKKEPKQILKEFSWLYIFFAIAAGVFAIVVGCIKELPEVASSLMPKNLEMELRTYLVIYFIVAGLIEVWYFWLVRRLINGKSKGILYIVLLVLGVAGNLYSLIFIDPKMSTFNLVIDAVALYFVYRFKKQENQ